MERERELGRGGGGAGAASGDRPCQDMVEGVANEWSVTRSTRPCEACLGFHRSRERATLSLRREAYWAKEHVLPEVESLAEAALEANSLVVQPVVPRPCGPPPVCPICPVQGAADVDPIQWPRARTRGPV